MKKTDLVEMVVRTGLSKKNATELVNEMFGGIVETLKKGEKVSISGLGTFSVSTRAARQGRNPKTGEPLNIPSSKSVKFKQAVDLKKKLN
jgi:DNA-binding protein HU-beta